MKTEGGQTVLYVNSLFEVNLTTSTNTSYYYLGGTLIAMSENATLKYIHKDHLGGTSVVTSDNGTLIESIKYYAFGETRSLTGEEATDKKFTGQRLDGTGLYYYNARYYGALSARIPLFPAPPTPRALTVTPTASITP
jgi:uncharacterized protein RhaS with RHS repeats